MPVATFTRAGQWGPEGLIDAAGDAQVGVAVALYLTDGTTLAIRYADRTKATTAANPWTSDAQGNVTVFADPGQYVLKVTVGGLVTPLSIEVPVDPTEAALDADVALTNAALAVEAGDRAAADAAHAAATSAVHGVAASTVESAAGAQAKADQAQAAAESAAAAYTDGKDATAAHKAANLSDLADEAAARSNLGLGTAATHAATDFDAAGASGAAQAAAVMYTDAETSRAKTAESGLAPAQSVSIFVRAQLVGFQPIGFDPSTDTVYLQSDSTGKVLYKTSDPDLTVVTPCAFAFPAGTTIRQVKRLSTGTLLAFVTTAGVNNLYRSTDGFTTAAIVLAGFGNTNTGTLQQNIAQNSVTGAVILCEYDAVPSADTFKTHISGNDGLTWADLETFVAFGGHIHGIFEDPTIAGRIWRCWGDTDAKCKIEWTENDGTNWTTLGSGSQSWRAVALLFTPTEIVKGTDTPTRPEDITAINKATLVRRPLLDDAGNTVYYAGQDAVSATGRHMWATGSSAADGQGITLWTGKLDGSTPMEAAYIPNVLSGATQNRMPIAGPSSTGFFYVAVTQIVSAVIVSKLFTCQLVDRAPGAAQVIALANPLTPGKPAKPTSVRVGDRVGLYTTTLALSNGREFMHKFTAPALPMGLLSAVYIKNGGVVAGNISVAIRGTKTNGDPDVVLSQSSAVAQAGTSVEQKLTLLTALALSVGQDYWFTLIGTNASGVVVAGGSTFDWQASGQVSKYCDQGAGTCPAPTAAPTSLVAGYDLVALLTLA